MESVRARCGCQTRLRSLSRLRSAALYEGPIELAVRRFKYDGWRRLAAPLGELLAERIVAEGLAAGWAVAVPLHPSRERARGFNQSELLARCIRASLRLAAPPGRLRRVRATPQQVGHDRLWRRQNVDGAFKWEGENLDRRPILLIDDVATTGATLDACAAALKSAGAGPVIGATVARVAL